jgi:protein-tyrosine kinase
MSKIFEALRKAEGEVADMALPVVTDDPADSGGADIVEGILRETMVEAAAPAAQPVIPSELPPEPLPEPPPLAAPVEVDAEAAPPVMEPELEAPAVISAPAPANGVPHSTGIRTIPVHLLVNAPVLPFDLKQRRAGEQYRMARTKLLHHPRQPRLVVISSAGSGDGKTVTAINLAGAMALKSEAEILLVDADLRRSQVASLLGIPKTPGLADVLTGGCQLEDAIVRVEQFPNLCVLPGGKPTANPVELLDSGRWMALCAAVRQQFKYVIFDAPPMATVADYDLIQAHCDGVVLVVRPDHTDRKLCMQALELVPKERLVGVVMNCVRDWFLWRTRDYYYYGQEN